MPLTRVEAATEAADTTAAPPLEPPAEIASSKSASEAWVALVVVSCLACCAGGVLLGCLARFRAKQSLAVPPASCRAGPSSAKIGPAPPKLDADGIPMPDGEPHEVNTPDVRILDQGEETLDGVTLDARVFDKEGKDRLPWPYKALHEVLHGCSRQPGLEADSARSPIAGLRLEPSYCDGAAAATGGPACCGHCLDGCPAGGGGSPGGPLAARLTAMMSCSTAAGHGCEEEPPRPRRGPRGRGDAADAAAAAAALPATTRAEVQDEVSMQRVISVLPIGGRGVLPDWLQDMT